MRVLPFIIITALAFAACRSEPPTATGRLERPSGLALIDRSSEEIPNREDLLVADSEAEGIKVVQYTGDPANLRIDFLGAPLVFFPLVVPAPGFPTEVVAVSARSTDRAYALAPGAGLLHVLDVPPISFQQSVIETPGYVSVRQIDLAAIAPGLIATDIALVGSEEGAELVAIAFEGVELPDQLWVLRVDSGDGDPPIVATATLASAPREISVRGAGTAQVTVLASSSATDFVNEVAFDVAAPGISVRSIRMIDVGGPTGQVVDAGSWGAFAIRIDRSRVVHLIPGPNGLVRSSAPATSPYTPIDERTDPSTLGTIDARQSPIGAAAFGDLDALTDPNPRATVSSVTGNNDPRIVGQRIFQRADGEQLPVLLLAHTDGTISFVVIEGDVAELAASLQAQVSRVATSEPSTLVSALDPISSSATGTCSDLIDCSDLTDASSCPSSMIRDPIPSFANYRATYRGAMVRSYDFGFAEDGAILEIVDPAVGDFSIRLVQPGDAMQIQIRVQCDGQVQPLEDTRTGSVVEVSGSTLRVEFTDPFAIQAGCSMIGGRYEIYPGTEQMVLVRLQAEQIVEVIERADVQTSSAGAFADFRQRLSMRISDQSFKCDDEPSKAIPCELDIDCGPARQCPDGAISTLCPRECGECDESSTACIREPEVRRCPRVDVETFPTVPFTLSGQEIIGNSVFPSAAPVAAVFSPKRDVWIVSYPGSRVLVEFRPSWAKDEAGQTVISGDFTTAHIR